MGVARMLWNGNCFLLHFLYEMKRWLDRIVYSLFVENLCIKLGFLMIDCYGYIDMDKG